MAGRPYILAETNWKAVRGTRYDVAILPWGATEAHNYHLPYGTDVIETDAVAAESARRAWDRGARVLALPCVPFGINTDIPAPADYDGDGRADIGVWRSSDHMFYSINSSNAVRYKIKIKIG